MCIVVYRKRFIITYLQWRPLMYIEREINAIYISYISHLDINIDMHMYMHTHSENPKIIHIVNIHANRNSNRHTEIIAVF